GAVGSQFLYTQQLNASSCVPESTAPASSASIGPPSECVSDTFKVGSTPTPASSPPGEIAYAFASSCPLNTRFCTPSTSPVVASMRMRKYRRTSAVGTCTSQPACTSSSMGKYCCFAAPYGV